LTVEYFVLAIGALRIASTEMGQKMRSMKYFRGSFTLFIAFVLVCVTAFGIAIQADALTIQSPWAAETTEDPSGGFEDSEDPPAPTPPVELTIQSAPSAMKVGDEAMISYTLKNVPGNMNIEWKSSNDEVVTVDSTGRVRALSPGDVEITASVGEVKSSVLIKVSEIAAESIKIEVREFTPTDMLLSEHELAIGDTLHLTAKIRPDNAMVRELNWIVSDKDAVTLNADGLLTAVAEGSVVVSVAVGDLSDSINIVIKKQGVNWTSILPMILGGIILVLVIGLIIVLVLLRKKRKEAEEREEAERKKKAANREKARREEADRLKEEAYMQGYTDSKRETVDRMTRVFNPDLEGRSEPPRDDFENPDDEPDKPFSIDDIE
jgi:large-conductance mechanosensitive channel